MTSDAPAAGVPSASGRSDGASLAGRRFFCSWSGGKDACLAFQRATREGSVPTALLCMLHEGGRVSRGHGLPLALLAAQAASLGVSLITRAATWDDYEATFVSALHELRAEGVEAGVFGDIDLQGHRDWVEGVCDIAGLSCHLHHTMVTDAPLFATPVPLAWDGVEERAGHHVLARVVTP